MQTPRIAVCKCSAGDIKITYPDGRTQAYIREPDGHQHGTRVIDAP